MHTGRVGHSDNLPPAATLIGVSDIPSAGQIFTEKGMQDYTHPIPLTTGGVKEVVAEFAEAASNAIQAGFDGIELHGANGYLLEQFLNPHINNRQDEYGGSVKNRCRFAIEVTEAAVRAIGKEKVGIRLSPFSVLGDLPAYDTAEVEETYEYLFKELNKLGIVYIHISSNPNITENLVKSLHAYYSGAIIWCNGLTPASGEKIVVNEKADLAAFGRLFLANPDLLSRIKAGASLNEVDAATFFSPGPAGYTDYPMLA
jgi:N-ethylmaleimide reductase